MIRPDSDKACDWPVDDVDDPVGCWQVFLEDGVLSRGFVHQDELLRKKNTTADKTIGVFMCTDFFNIAVNTPHRR